MIAASWGGDKEAAGNAQRIWKKLSGTADPNMANKRGMSEKEIKQTMNGLTLKKEIQNEF